MAQTHTVAEGESMFTIAEQYGFGYWETIYFHPQNQPLRDRCPDPQLLEPGASVFIPDRATKPVPVRTNKKHTLVVHRIRARVSLAVVDEEGVPMKHTKYTLQVAGQDYRGVTDEKGRIEEDVKPAKTGKLTLFPREDHPHAQISYDIRLTGLAPVDDVRGLQMRLANLGLYHDAIDGQMNDGTKEAIKAFKREHLDYANPNDEIDDDLRQLIVGMSSPRSK